MGRVRPHSAPRIGAAHCQPHGRARMGPRPGRGISHRADSHYPPSLHWRRSPATTVPCLRIETTWISSVNHARQRRRMLLCLLLVYASSRTELDWTDVGWFSRRSTTAGLGVSCGTAQLGAVRPVVSTHPLTSASVETGAKSDSSREQQQQQYQVEERQRPFPLMQSAR